MPKRPPPKSTFLHDLLDAGLAIKETSATDADKAYMAKHLVQCTLPHRDPGDVRIWTRKNGTLRLTIEPFHDRDTGRALYPYGSIPRLVLFWLVSEVTKQKNGAATRRIELGENLDNFMRQIGLSPRTGGGKRGDAVRLRQQMERLFRSTLSFEDLRGVSFVDMKIAPKGEFWWKAAEPEQGKLWISWIELGEEFYEAVKKTVVPVDVRALYALKRSPLALDLYALLAYKTDSANRKKARGEDLAPITWEGLHEQMGAEYTELKHFKPEVVKALKKIEQVSEMRFDVTEEGLKVHPGKTPISPADKRTRTIEGRGNDHAY